MVAAFTSSWSYSHFLYKLYQPFRSIIDNADTVMQMTRPQVEELLQKMIVRLNELHGEMQKSRLSLRPNRMYIHCVDIDYDYPQNYNFLVACEKFIESSGIIVFQHLQNFEIVKKYIEMYKGVTTAQHPLTADTLWHLSPFNIDMMHVYVVNIYNFRGETPNERRMLAELLNFPQVHRMPFDVKNVWDEDSHIFVDCSNGGGGDGGDETTIDLREPVALCKSIRKNGIR